MSDELGAMLMREYGAIQGFVRAGEKYMRDVDFLALIAEMSGFMEHFEEPKNNGARLALQLLQPCPDTREGRSPSTMVVMGIWYCDNDGFREKAMPLLERRG